MYKKKGVIPKKSSAVFGLFMIFLIASPYCFLLSTALDAVWWFSGIPHRNGWRLSVDGLRNLIFSITSERLSKILIENVILPYIFAIHGREFLTHTTQCSDNVTYSVKKVIQL